MAADFTKATYRAALEQIAALKEREFIGEDYALRDERVGWHERPTLVAKIAIAALEAGCPDDEAARPSVITLCGSSRFPDAFALANMHLSMLGHVVINLGCFGHADYPVGARHLTSDGDETTPEKQHLDQLHFRKIDISDGIFVVNPGGYVGSSTKREIEYARAQGKTVEWLFGPSEPGCAGNGS